MDRLKIFCISFLLVSKLVQLCCLCPSPLLGFIHYWVTLLSFFNLLWLCGIFFISIFYFTFGSLVLRLFSMNMSHPYFFSLARKYDIFFDAWLQISIQVDKINIKMQDLRNLMDHYGYVPFMFT